MNRAHTEGLPAVGNSFHCVSAGFAGIVRQSFPVSAVSVTLPALKNAKFHNKSR